MPGIFDLFTSEDPMQRQGLLSAAAAILDASGPSLVPRSLGQVVAQGIGGYQKGLQSAQTNQINALKLKDAESDLQDQQAKRDYAKRLREFYMGDSSGQATPMPAPQSAGALFKQALPASQMGGGDFMRAALSAGLPTDNGTLNKIVGDVNQGMIPEQASVAQAPSIYHDRLALAQRLRHAGFSTEADAQEAAALKFQPKVKEWRQVKINGQVLYAPYFEDGTPGKPVPYEVAEKLEKVNRGGTTDMVNPFTGATVTSMTNTASPDAILSAETQRRGQNMTDARAKEAAQAGRIPAGYRLSAGGNLEAIPGGPAADKITSPQQKAQDARDVLALLDQAEPLIDKATGSYGGMALDAGARVFGASTQGAQAAAQLKALEGMLVSKMPKMSGPQSDKDVLLYKQMAGQIGDPTIPADTKKAAMDTIREINQRYIGTTPKFDVSAIPQGAKSMLKMNPKLRDQFDAKYGAGAAASVLGK